MSRPEDDALDRLAHPADRDGFVDWEAHDADIATVRARLDATAACTRYWKERHEAAEAELATATATMELAIRKLEAAEAELAAMALDMGDALRYIEQGMVGHISDEGLGICRALLARLDQIGKEQA